MSDESDESDKSDGSDENSKATRHLKCSQISRMRHVHRFYGFASLDGGRCVIGLAHSGELAFATQASWCFSGVGSVSRSLTCGYHGARTTSLMCSRSRPRSQ